MNAHRTIRMLLLGVVLIVPGWLLAQSPTASGVINASLMNKSGISLIFHTDSANGVSLLGEGTNAATLDFGHVAMFMPTPPTHVTLTRGTSSFTISTNFNVYVDVAGMTSPTYSLSASLSTAAGVYTYALDGKTLSATPVQVNSADTYKVDVPHTLAITIPAASPAGALSNTINFVATSN